MARRKRRGIEPLPTMAVGGGSIPQETVENVVKDLAEKTEKYKSEVPQKPDIEIKRVDAPLEIKRDYHSQDAEYIETAKRYLNIPKYYNMTVVDFAKAVITLVKDNVELVKRNNELMIKVNHSQIYNSKQSTGEW